jgi:hypothetical protein
MGYARVGVMGGGLMACHLMHNWHKLFPLPWHCFGSLGRAFRSMRILDASF